jgi:glycosyltransferase involved in cell wall biosynthesis
MAGTIIVVPCYNEARRLDVAAFRRFLAMDTGVRLLFVDDGSTDATRSVLGELTAGSGDLAEVLALPANVGKAEAVRRGIEHALLSHPEFVGYWDADLATPLEEIDTFLGDLRRQPDLIAVIGSRVRRLGAEVERQAVRHYLGRIFATVASLVLGLAVYDTQCGAKIFRVSDQVASAFATPFVSRWIFDVEVLARLSAWRRVHGGPPLEKSVLEYPLGVWRDVAGSKLNAAHMVGAFLDLMRIGRRHCSRSALPPPSAPPIPGIPPNP